MHEFSVRYTEDIARRSVRVIYARRLRRQLDWKLCAAFVATIGFLALSHLYGTPAWLDGAVAALVGLIIAFAVILYRTHLRRTLERLHEMRQPIGTFLVTEATLTVSSERGSSTVPWATFVGVTEHRDFWVQHSRGYEPHAS